uniref:Gap junction protein n=1 Tax=Gallus gallus TaxID=9031 RepID=A0A8V0XSJ3_CHICK
MGEWTILERLLEAAVQQHSTMIGRILLTVVVIFRILIVAIVGETVYEDEQTMFMCNTLQPGCNQACYDKAFPISHIRYWVFQIILVCTPSLCFITYSVHQAAKQRERRYSFLYPLLERDAKKARTLNGVLAPGADGGTKDEPECLEAKELPSTPPRRAKAKRQEGISRFYVIQVVFRNALEIGFLAGQYFLYGFNVPAIFECDRYPCVKEVECYVSRPTEKTVFLVFMFAVSGICVLLNLAELNHLGWRKVKAAVRGVQARRKSLVEVRKKDGAALTPAPTLGRTQSTPVCPHHANQEMRRRCREVFIGLGIRSYNLQQRQRRRGRPSISRRLASLALLRRSSSCSQRRSCRPSERRRNSCCCRHLHAFSWRRRNSWGGGTQPQPPTRNHESCPTRARSRGSAGQ